MHTARSVDRAGGLLIVVAGAGAALLLVAAVTVLMVQVDVRDGGRPARSCGSAFDVVAGRTGWETWRAQDLVDGSTTRAGMLLRTDRCPGVVNARIVLAGLLAGAAVIVGAVAATVVATRARATRPGRGPAHEGAAATSRRVRRLGIIVEVVGVVLTVAGLVAIVSVTADPNATLFLYVDRPVVALIGLVLLLPVVALAIGGRALVLFASAVERRDHDT